jgi:thymidylate synthase (FAD)
MSSDDGRIPLGDNIVQLTGVYGSDETHALSAWTSTSRDLTEEKRSRMKGLLAYLAREGHHTPFEKSTLQFLITCETASHIHVLKHRIGVSCVTGDTEIHIPNPGGGVRKRTIKQLYQEHVQGIRSASSRGKSYYRKYGRPVPVRSKAENSHLIEKDSIKQVFYNGKREVYRFTSESGKTITSTLDHQFYTGEEGWQGIGDYLGVELVFGKAVFSNKDNLVATNGVKLDDPSRPWTSREFFSEVENKMTRTQAAKHLGMTYPNLKKWGYIHGIKFTEDPNKDFPKGNKPWNYHKYGYKLNRVKKGLNPATISANQELYKDKKVWRAAVANWTREQLPALMKKYDYQCQGPLKCHSRDFNCHHIIPVDQDNSLALEFNNLILVCVDCHKWIHQSLENTQWYVDNYSSIPVSLTKKPRKGRKLSLDFERIVSVEYMGVQDVYDLETHENHNYVANGFVIHNCNAESARYKELKDDKFYIPPDWPKDLQDKLANYCQEGLDLYHQALEELKEADFDRKRAKESARFFLPYANQLTLDVSFNFRSFMHFQGLRNKPDAQDEIEAIAEEMLRLVRETGQFDDSLEGFGYSA